MALRYRVSQINLARHLPPGPLRVLDAGGGNGAEALPLAAQGHQVTIADYSAAMLAEACQAADAAGLAERVITVHAALSELPGQIDAYPFDLILCHNVLQYLDDGASAIAALAARLRPDGLLSLITANPTSEVLRAALAQTDPAAALAALDAPTAQTAVFGVAVQRYPTDTLRTWLEAAGLQLVGHYGIRCVNDYLAANEPKYDPTFAAALEQLELALSGRDPYRQIARFTHLVAQR